MKKKPTRQMRQMETRKRKKDKEEKEEVERRTECAWLRSAQSEEEMRD